jgi:DNA repair protein RecO
VNQVTTQGIVLARTNYGEADRIITVLTPDHGKLRLMARGVRKPKSKLAGGIELFSVSDLSYIEGRGEIGTLTSSRLRRHFGHIVKDIERVQLGYDLIKMLNRATEDEPETEYFTLLEQTFTALNEQTDLNLIQTWFQAQLLKLAGHSPNLQTGTGGQKLTETQTYNFDLDAMSFAEKGNFKAAHIKVLRLLFNQNITSLSKVEGLTAIIPKLQPLIRSMFQSHIRV